jgi:protein-S-isoprenylcysteine O-methyltransferase Ste14
MDQRPSEWRVPILSGIAGLAALLGAMIFRDELPIPKAIGRAVGFTVVSAGMALFLWSAFYLKSATGGLIAPRLTKLVVDGPFRLVRHPTYLAMLIALVGASLATRSAIGLAATLLFFLPVEIHRARMEEQALSHTFGGEAWQEYVSRTGFLLPRLLCRRRTSMTSERSQTH